MFDREHWTFDPPGGEVAPPDRPPSPMTIPQLRALNRYHLDGLHPVVRKVIDQELRWRWRRYPTFDDALWHVVAAPLGGEGTFASGTVPEMGAHQPVLVFNSDRFGPEADLDAIVEEIVAQRYSGVFVHSKDPFRATWRHEVLHNTTNVLLDYVEGAKELLQSRIAYALGVPKYEPGRLTAAAASEMSAQLGFYGSQGRRAGAESQEDYEDTQFREAVTEALTSYEEWGEHAPPVARAVGSVARVLRFDAPGVADRNAELYTAFRRGALLAAGGDKEGAEALHRATFVPANLGALASTPQARQAEVAGLYEPARITMGQIDGQTVVTVLTSDLAELPDRTEADAAVEAQRLSLGLPPVPDFDTAGDDAPGAFASDEPVLWADEAIEGGQSALDEAVSTSPASVDPALGAVGSPTDRSPDSIPPGPGGLV